MPISPDLTADNFKEVVANINFTTDGLMVCTHVTCGHIGVHEL